MSDAPPPEPATVEPPPSPDALTVLVVDDEPSNLSSIEKIFQKDGMRVLTAPSARAALDLLRAHRVDVVLTDLMMPAVSGLELLRAIRQAAPDVEVVLMTAYGTVETAVQAMREGAYDFVEKPLKRMTIVKTVRKAAERRTLTLENRQLKQELNFLTGREIVGTSPALRRVLDIVLQAAPSSATVLVLGESGTGKELLARYILGDGAKIQFTQVNSSTREQVLINDQVDLVVATYSITPSRAEKISFAGPYYTSQAGVLVKANNKSIQSYNDLAGKKVATQAGSTGPAILAQFAPKSTVQEFQTHQEALDSLRQGRVDAYVTDYTLLLNTLSLGTGDAKLAGTPFGAQDPYGIGLRKGSDGVAFVNAFLKKIESDGTWAKLWTISIGQRTGSTAVPTPPALP